MSFTEGVMAATIVKHTIVKHEEQEVTSTRYELQQNNASFKHVAIKVQMQLVSVITKSAVREALIQQKYTKIVLL